MILPDPPPTPPDGLLGGMGERVRDKGRDNVKSMICFLVFVGAAEPLEAKKS